MDIGSIRLIFTEKKRDNPQCFLYKTSIKNIFNLIGRTKKVRSINITSLQFVAITITCGTSLVVFRKWKSQSSFVNFTDLYSSEFTVI